MGGPAEHIARPVALSRSQALQVMLGKSFNAGDFDAAMVDLDGTLVDTLGDFVAAVNAMLADLHKAGQALHQLDAAIVGRMVGKGSENLVRAVLAHAAEDLPDRYAEAIVS